MPVQLAESGSLTKVVTGYRWTDDQGMVPIWGPPALSAPARAKPRPEVNKNGEPKPDRVITKWKMGGGSIFRLKAHLPQPDGRLIVIYCHSFDEAMSLLKAEAKSDLPWRVNVDYNGKHYSLWRSRTTAFDPYRDCCQDLADDVRRRYDAGEFDKSVEVCT